MGMVGLLFRIWRICVGDILRRRYEGWGEDGEDGEDWGLKIDDIFDLFCYNFYLYYITDIKKYKSVRKVLYYMICYDYMKIYSSLKY